MRASDIAFDRAERETNSAIVSRHRYRGDIVADVVFPVLIGSASVGARRACFVVEFPGCREVEIGYESPTKVIYTRIFAHP